MASIQKPCLQQSVIRRNTRLCIVVLQGCRSVGGQHAVRLSWSTAVVGVPVLCRDPVLITTRMIDMIVMVITDLNRGWGCRSGGWWTPTPTPMSQTGTTLDSLAAPALLPCRHRLQPLRVMLGPPHSCPVPGSTACRAALCRPGTGPTIHAVIQMRKASLL